MAQFASDTFTDTAGTTLSSHSANWIKHSTSGSGNLVISDANRVRYSSSGSSESFWYHAGTPASADYTVKADYVRKDGSNGAIFVTGRTSTSNTTYYGARYNYVSGAGNWELFKRIVGSFTQLGSGVSQTLTVDTAYEGKLKMVGSTIELFKEGSGTASISVTDTSITAAGKAGLRASGYAGSDTTSLHIDNFSADDIVGSSATSNPLVRAFPRSILNH